ncbi:hypothetical protein HDU96_003483 [Phlyctochytrium bullatum]|nr:hypothetical protein HDU96_003483 [Phlyctochytrium bullatum]
MCECSSCRLDDGTRDKKLWSACVSDESYKFKMLLCKNKSRQDSINKTRLIKCDKLAELRAGNAKLFMRTASFLQYASHHGSIMVVNYLLGEGAEVGYSDEQCWTSLHHAAVGGHMGVIDALVHHGAELDPRDINGCTPLHVAAHYQRPSIIRFLVAVGADPNCTDHDGWTPLHYAVNTTNPFHPPTLTALIHSGADVNSQTTTGETPVWYAAASGSLAAVRFLVEQNCDVDIADYWGSLPLSVARKNGHKSVVKFLSRITSEAASLTTQTTQTTQAIQTTQTTQTELQDMVESEEEFEPKTDTFWLVREEFGIVRRTCTDIMATISMAMMGLGIVALITSSVPFHFA